jgi:hypothetical protein
MQHPAVKASHPPARKDSQPETRPTSSHVILNGIAKLLEGQRLFAEEFGLPYTRVFHQECQIFRDQEPDQVIRQWLQDKADGPSKFSRLIDDIVEHHLALCAALDGVAQESISQLSPTTIKARGFSIFGWRPFPWLTFRRLHRNYQTNDYLRHQELVVKGFAKAYASHRDSFRQSPRPDVILSTPKNPKEKS